MNYLLIVLFSLAAVASDFPDDPLLAKLLSIDSDSAIKGPAYSKIVEELKSLEASYGDFAQVITFGQTVDGKPLSLIKIAKKSITSNQAIYIGGSIHGNEYLNIEDRLPRWFLEQTANSGTISAYLEQGGVIYVAPILNPDGYDRRERENRNGVDLNRDYTVIKANVEGFKEIETRSLFEYLSRDLGSVQLKVAMDYHCCIGALLYPWSFTGPVLSSADREKHLLIASIMQSTIGPGVKAGTTPDILGYSAKGTSKDFYYEHFGALGFTYEGRKGKEDRFFEEHTSMWEAIVKTLIGSRLIN
jgi:succinylglutamate desuccinylase